MPPDFGLRAERRFAESPAWQLSPRALRLWLWLGMKAQHRPFTCSLGETTLTVRAGELLLSQRALMKQTGGRSSRQVVADLAELERHGCIARTTLSRPVTRSQSRSTPAPNVGAPTRSQVGSTSYSVGTLITVVGVRVTRDPAPKLGATSKKRAISSPFSAADLEHLQSVEGQLLKEGR